MGGRGGRKKYYSKISDLGIESAISDSGTKSILLTKFEYLVSKYYLLKFRTESIFLIWKSSQILDLFNRTLHQNGPLHWEGEG